MSQLSRGILGAIAVSLTFGAALAANRDLAGTQISAASSEAVNTSAAINRAAKVDRADGAAGSAAPTRTISLRLDALTATSVLIRLPVTQGNGKEARNSVPAPAPAVAKPQARKTAVACEPPVSVLTEVAKRLEPGRCVT
jgi:hypothetical protein